MLVYIRCNVAKTCAHCASDVDEEAYAHIMNLLSATVNASLAELGHFPGSGALLHEIRRNNYQLQNLCAKSREENATLQHVIDKQRQDMNQLQSKNSQLQIQLRELRRSSRAAEEKLRKMTVERDNLVSYSRTCVSICLAEQPRCLIRNRFTRLQDGPECDSMAWTASATTCSLWYASNAAHASNGATHDYRILRTGTRRSPSTRVPPRANHGKYNFIIRIRSYLPQ